MARSASKEITETILRIGNAKTVQELNTEDLSEQTKKIADTLLECSMTKVQEPELSDILSSFRKGAPSKAHLRLIELRSAISIFDQSSQSSSLNSSPVNLDKEHPLFSEVYKNFLAALVRAVLCDEAIGREYIESGCVEGSLRELNSLDFQNLKIKSPQDSPTAHAINRHLTIMLNISSKLSLQLQMGEQLQRHGYFQTLQKFTQNSYVESTWHYK